MSYFILKRFFQAIPTLWIIITLAFLLMHAMPGGPFDGERVASPTIRASLEKQYHLDQPLYKQYGIYLNNVLHGDFGPSFKYRDFTVNQLIYDGLPVSMTLGFYTMVFSIVIGVALGILAGWKQNSQFDYFAMIFALVGMSIPSFVTAPLMILLFAVLLGLLPAGHWEGPISIENLIMPVLALSLPMISYITRIMRGSVIEVLNSSFIRTARSKGLPEWKVLFFHALKPAILPVISFVGPATASILTGSIVIEQIFGLPGVGQHFIKGAINRDYTLVMGIVILSAFFIIMFNLITDIIYAYLDPRIRYD
ncbi:MAG: oligopeptide ABC transporter permease OppB [Gammaproteobacteria bacterium]|nr:oligopeptide ABC transporter permease OppB [Gammaproteobacteria bacterium]